MPDYLVTDPATGQRIKMTGPAPPSEALIRLALAKVQPLPSHVQQTKDPLQAMQKAQTIGPARVGERYLEPLNPSAVDVVRSLAGGAARPSSVNAADPYGIEAWQKGAGPMPAPIMGETEGLYSRLDQAIAKLPDTKLPPMKILSTAKNATSGEEIAHRGLADFLQAAGGKPVARSEVQAHLAANPINLDVKVMGGGKNAFRVTPTLNLPADAVQAFPRGQVPHFAIVNAENTPISFHQTYEAARSGLDELETMGIHGSGPAPKYSQYQVPGGTAYKETLITLPTKEQPRSVTESARVLAEDAGDNWENLGPNGRERYMQQVLNKPTGTFRSSHFEQPNILVHVRSNERTLPSGEPGLFLEEVQSDWHQKGKAEGYATKPDTSQWKATRAGEGDDGWWNVYDGAGTRLGTVRHGDVGGGGARTADQALQEVAGRSKFTGVPDAPFKEQWPDLALKHQLLDAAKRPDLQWLGFTSGETQAARYDLSKQISRVEYNPSKQILRAYDLNRNEVIQQHNVNPQALSNHIGKEAADRLLSSPIVSRGEGGYGDQIHRLEGMDLKVGGEGMKYFYDQLLPKRLEKIVKPFGGTVERAPLVRPTADINREIDAVLARDPEHLTAAESARYQALQRERNAAKDQPIHGWIVRLTPEMKQRILKEGLPLMTGLAAVAAGQQEQK